MKLKYGKEEIQLLIEDKNITKYKKARFNCFTVEKRRFLNYLIF